MCFAPYVSLSTFIIEFLIAIFFLAKNPRDKLNQAMALLVFMLGFYQLNEFLICTTGANVFTKLAMITTAILPAFSITLALIMWKKPLKWYFHLVYYVPSIFFILWFSISNAFASSAQCMSVFIKYPAFGIVNNFYGLYYLVFLIATIIIYFIASHIVKKRQEKVMLSLGILSVLIFTIPTYIFLLFLPSQKILFSSVLCEFALLLSILLIFVMWYKDKHKLKY
ncbi:hypothetical protein ACFL1H_06595 [Nanoarchaeota archaeon]